MGQRAPKWTSRGFVSRGLGEGIETPDWPDRRFCSQREVVKQPGTTILGSSRPALGTTSYLKQVVQPGGAVIETNSRRRRLAKGSAVVEHQGVSPFWQGDELL